MNAPSTKFRLRKSPPPPKKNNTFLLFLCFCTILGIIFLYKGVDFLEEDAEGNVQLSKERQEKLDQRLKDLQQGWGQYVLQATISKYYPCYNCGKQDSIFLLKGQIWKYGMKRLGIPRYTRTFLSENGLLLIIEFKGTLEQCLEQEQIKIFNYAKLPENLARTPPLIRPPGNKIDR